MRQSRQDFLRRGVLLGAGLAAAGLLPRVAGAQEMPEVTPPEDLMREHGVLNRILLIYEDALCRLDDCKPFMPRPLHAAAGIIRRFIEDYHEKSEEQYVFPRFRKAGKLVDLVDTLEAQHRAGRRLTERILSLADASTEKDEKRRDQLADALALFLRMYRPHEAREDTVLFPALRSVVTPREFADMAEAFEKREKELFGPSGFESVVAQVADLEKQLGIYELSQFTPS